MKIWDVSPMYLCRQHLLGEHRELHATWTVLTQGKKRYSNHPEVKRWVGKLKALYTRHDALVEEMTYRDYNHKTPLDSYLATGENIQNKFINSLEEQILILIGKGCGCRT